MRVWGPKKYINTLSEELELIENVCVSEICVKQICVNQGLVV